MMKFAKKKTVIAPTAFAARIERVTSSRVRRASDLPVLLP
jgi:hypothetical protein